MRVSAGFVDWLPSGDAARLARAYIWDEMNQDVLDLSPGREADEKLGLAKEANATLAAVLRSQDPVWCDANMTDLLAVATAEHPPVDTIEPWHLLHPTAGLVIFAKPLPTEWSDLTAPRLPAATETGTSGNVAEEISAISWERPLGEGPWVVRTWARTTDTRLFNMPDVGRFRCRDLRPTPVVEVIGAATPPSAAARILVALTALTRTGTTVQEAIEDVSKAARQSARRARMEDRQVRRLYLRHPESGPAELAAFRERRSAGPRGHWVRGHWKQQWYASTQEHQWQWVDGYPRGDFTLGTVQGQRVQVVRADSDEGTTA